MLCKQTKLYSVFSNVSHGFIKVENEEHCPEQPEDVFQVPDLSTATRHSVFLTVTVLSSLDSPHLNSGPRLVVKFRNLVFSVNILLLFDSADCLGHSIAQMESKKLRKQHNILIIFHS